MYVYNKIMYTDKNIVEQFIRDEEVACSNHVTPIEKARKYKVSWLLFLLGKKLTLVNFSIKLEKE